HPDYSIAVGRGLRRLDDAPDVRRIWAILWQTSPERHANDSYPFRNRVLNVLSEPRVFLSTTRHDRDKLAAIRVDMGHVPARAKLAVGNVHEVRMTNQAAKRVPGIDVR